MGRLRAGFDAPPRRRSRRNWLVRRVVALLIVSSAIVAGLPFAGPLAVPSAGADPAGTETFGYTGSVQAFTVPAGVTSVRIGVWGAEGGLGYHNVPTQGRVGRGGRGGYAEAVIATTPGETLNIYVGESRNAASTISGVAFNGGGSGGSLPTYPRFGGPGGGASDVRRGTSLADRVVVAGGGGGAGCCGWDGPSGGPGGGLNGYAGATLAHAPGYGCSVSTGGGGGTQSAGGAYGYDQCSPSNALYQGTAGVLGAGGTGGKGQSNQSVYNSGTGGGGGGGFYGGGGGGGSYESFVSGGGGGGSSYVTGSSTVIKPGVHCGSGFAALSWGATPLPVAPGSCPSYGFGSWGHGSITGIWRSDPVNTATGAFTHEVVDATMPAAGVPFSFVRSYSSANAAESLLGSGWTSNYGAALLIDAAGVTFRSDDGGQFRFVNNSGVFVAEPGVLSKLETVSGGYKLTRRDLVAYSFDTAGKLTSIKDRTGIGVTLAYISGRLASVTDAASRTFTFTYDTNGHLSRLTLADGRHVDYTVTSDRLTAVADVRGQTTAYRYDTAGRLDRETDPNGHTVFENIYGTDGRVIEQRDSFGNATIFAWNAATETSTMTDPKGKTWTDDYSAGVLIGTTEPSGTTGVSWDEDLNPVGGTDANGKSWSATYDAGGNLLTRTAPAPLSYVETWTYDSTNNPLTYTDGRGNTTTYTYDTTGRLTTRTWPGGATETRTYSASGQVASLTDANNHTTTYGYDANGNLTSVTTAAGSVTTYTYDAAGRVLTKVDPRGNVAGATPADYTTTWTYDAAGNVLTETDSLGRTTTSTYSGTGNVLTRTDPAGRVTTFAYNDADEPTSVTAPDGSVTSTSYDDRGQVASTTDALGNVTTFIHDGAGRQTSMTDPRGKVWTMAHDANGNQTSVTDPLGHVSSRAYDPLNRQTSFTDANGHTTTYGYDTAGNRTSVTDPLGHVTSYAFDARNRLISVTDPLGKVTSFGYDADGNRTSATTPLGATTTWTYDAANNAAAIVDPLGNAPGGTPADHTTTFAYDVDGRQTSVTDPLGNTTTSTFDRAGQLVGRTDANGHATAFTYDPVGRLATVTGPDAAVTSYDYDVAGNLASKTDPNGHMTAWAYDGAHRVTTRTDPIGRRWTFGHDPDGNRTTVTDAIANAAGVPTLGTTTVTYDAAGRPTAVDYSDATPDLSYGYDNAGNRISMTDAVGTETRGYDAADRLTTVTRGTDTFSYGYDDANRLTARTYPGGAVTALAYNDDGRLTTATAGSEVTTYGYDVAGRLLTTNLPNGYVATRAWDNTGRLTGVTNIKAGTTLSAFAYGRDNVGNPTSITTPVGVDTLGYDAANRLVSDCQAAVCAPGDLALTTWAYDGVGNRTAQATGPTTTTYAYDPADQLTATVTAGVSVPFSYDANGRQTSDGVRSFGWDLAGRLIATGVGPAATTTYSYDGDGRRVAATAAGLPVIRTTTLWDPNSAVPQVALERDATGAALRSYTYGLDRIGMTAAGTSHYFHGDELGSVANVTSATGSTEWSYSYDPFGTARSTTKNDPQAPANLMRFAGEHLDETGGYNLRARELDVSTGRLLSRDPLAPDLTDPAVSPYAYVDDRPTALVDPTGERGRFIGAYATPTFPRTLVAPTGARVGGRIAGSLQGRLAGGIAGAVLADWVLADPAGDPVADQAAGAVYQLFPQTIGEAAPSRRYRSQVACEESAAGAAGSLLPYAPMGIRALPQGTNYDAKAVGKGAAIAAGVYCIDRMFGTAVAVSGQSVSLPGTLNPSDPTTLQTTSGRRYDAEFKLLEGLIQQGVTRRASVGALFMEVDAPGGDVCASCQNVLGQFAGYAPGVATVVHSRNMVFVNGVRWS